MNKNGSGGYLEIKTVTAMITSVSPQGRATVRIRGSFTLQWVVQGNAL